MNVDAIQWMDETGIVETVLCGVVGRDPAKDCMALAFKDCIVPIWKEETVYLLKNFIRFYLDFTLKCAKSSSFVKSESSK